MINETPTEHASDKPETRSMCNDRNGFSSPQSSLEERSAVACRILEAVLFAAAQPIPERTLAKRVPDDVNIRARLRELQAEYAGRGVNLVNVGTSWAFRTAEDLGPVLNVTAEVERKLSRAALETLAIIAYHQPVSRPEIEEVRGAGLSRGTLDLLFDKGWIKPRGRREAPGRPMTWGTTDVFLDHFGLEKLADLPGVEDLKAAGLLEVGPALNIYRSRGGNDPAKPPGPGNDDHDDRQAEDPLDPGVA